MYEYKEKITMIDDVYNLALNLKKEKKFGEKLFDESLTSNYQETRSLMIISLLDYYNKLTNYINDTKENIEVNHNASVNKLKFLKENEIHLLRQ